LTTLHLRGRTLGKYQEAPTLTYDDDGYIKGKMIMEIQVLTDPKHVLKEDDGLDLNVCPRTPSFPRASDRSLGVMWCKI
jgi:hypothetical protein